MKYNKILAVGVTGALLLSITGSVQPLNQAKALSTPQTSATNTLDVKNLHDGIYSIDAIIINAPWLLNNMIDIDKTRLIVKDGQYKVELNTKYFEDVFFVYHMWNLKYLDSGAEKDAQITGWHDTNSPGYEVNTEASRAVEYFRNYPDRYAFPKTIVYPVDKSKIDSTNELDTYIICDCGTYKTQRCIYREKLVLKFATLKPIELDYSKEKVTAKEKIRDLSFLNGEEFNDFNRKIDQAKDEKEIQNLVDQAITQDNANKEAKTKALAEIGKLANLNEEEKAEFKEKINKTDSAAVANEVLKQAREKDKANKELKDAKTKALAEIGKLADLDEKEKEYFKAEIPTAGSIEEVNCTLAKANALVELGKLANLTDEEKAGFQEKISAADSKEAADKVVDKAKVKDKEELSKAKGNASNKLVELGMRAHLDMKEIVDFKAEIDNASSIEKVNVVLAKANALAEIYELADLDVEEIDNFKAEILAADSKEKVDVILAKSKEKANKELKEAKEKAKALIDKLDVLSKEEKDNLKAEIVKMNSRHEFDVFFDKVDELLKQAIAKEKALADLAKLANLDEKEKESFKAEINNAQEKTKVEEVLNQAKEKDKANKELKDAKTKALAEIGKLANLDEKEKEYFKKEIHTVGSIEGVNDTLAIAKRNDKANKELKEEKEKALEELGKLANLDEKEKDDLKAEINKAQEKTKVEEVLNQAKEKEKAREEIEKLANAIENAKAEINKLANLADGEKASFNEEIDIADSIEKVNDALARAREKDKEALAKVKAKVKEEIEKLANLTKDQKEAAKEKIDKASSIEEVDEARTKVKAKAAIEKFANLTKEQKDNLKEEIDKADSLEQVKEVFVKAKEKDKANKEAKEAKTKALEELGKLANLDEKEKENFKELINQAEDKKEINRVLDRAKVKNTANKAKEELKLIIEKKFQDPQQKAAVLKDLEKLKTLKEVEQLKADIEGSVTIGEYNDKKLAEVKAKALAEIDKLDDISKEDKDKLKDLIDKINSIDGFNKFFDEGKEKLKAEIDKFDDLSKDEKDNLKAEIDKTTNSIEAIDKVFDKVKEKLKAVIDKLDNLSKEEKESAKAEIYKANNAKEVNDALAKAKAKDKANKDAKENTIYKIGYLDNLTKEQKESLIAEVNSKKAKDEIEKIYQKAKELDKKQRKDVTPNPSLTPDVTPTPETEAGWLKDEIGWSYQRANGSIAKAEWEMINGTWYHFDSKGYTQTGWLNLGGTWYYLNDDGSMAKDTWIGTYYVDENGAWVVEGWQNNGYGWWYQRANGTYPHSEWEIINGIWYYFDANGYMLKDEATPDGYYVDENGAWVK